MSVIPPQLAEKVMVHPEMDNSWDGILENGETILWHGAPVRGFRWTIGFTVSLLCAGIVGLAGGLPFWANRMAQQMGGIRVNGVMHDSLPGSVLMIGCFLVFLAVLIPIVTAIIGRRRRARTYYTLTNRRGFVARAFSTKKLEFHRFNQWTQITSSGGSVGSVTFYSEKHQSDGDARFIRRGFEHIENPEEVYRTMLRIKKEVCDT